MKIFFALLALLVATAIAENDVYMGGDFLLSFVTPDDGDLNHITGLAAYIPEEDKYIDLFDGGVYSNTGYLTVMQDTPLGFYCAGVFRYVGNSYHYSSAVLHYNHDDDEYEPLNDGIFVRSGESVRLIAGTQDYTYFAGYFTEVEYISKQADDDGQVLVPSIARVDENGEWSALPDPDNAFPATTEISAMTSNDQVVYIYTKGALYSWTEENNFVKLSTLSLIGDIAADTYGNVAGISFDAGVSGIGTYDLVTFAEENYHVASLQISTITPGQCNISSVPSVYAWADGFLVAVPDTAVGCLTTNWLFYNSTMGSMDTSFNQVPSTTGIDEISVGDNNDIWMVDYSNTIVYYLPYLSGQFIEVDLSVFGDITIATIAWNNGPDKLMVCGSSPSDGHLLIELNPDAYPPAVKLKSPGMLAVGGTVNSLAVMNDPDDDDFELYVGGRFDAIANGLQVNNFVQYKAGAYGTPLPNLPPIVALSTTDSTIFYATNACSRNGGQLPVGYYSKDTRTADVWVNVPVVTDGNGCVTALYASERSIIVAGTFTVSVPGNGDLSHGIVIFDRLTNQWSNIETSGIISSDFDFDIKVITATTIDDVEYLAFGGHFDLNSGTKQYHGFAMLNMASGEFLPPPLFQTDTIVNDIVIQDLSNVYIAGNILSPSSSGAGVLDTTTNVYTVVGEMPLIVDSLLLFSEKDHDDVTTWLYAGGDFVNGTAHAGVAYLDATNADADTVYENAGQENQFSNFYQGNVDVMIYTTGGQGSQEQNGYVSSYTAPDLSDSGMSGWGKFFLTMFILLLITLVVVGAAGGGYFLYQKRSTYQAL